MLRMRAERNTPEWPTNRRLSGSNGQQTGKDLAREIPRNCETQRGLILTASSHQAPIDIKILMTFFAFKKMPKYR